MHNRPYCAGCLGFNFCLAAGSPLDEGLAAYYASALPESELHPAWSLYHQQQRQRAGAGPVAEEVATEAARAPAQQPADERHSRRPQGHEQPVQGMSQAAPQQQPLAHDVDSAADHADMHDTAGPDGHPVNRLQQGLAQTRDRIARVLEQPKATADRIRSSSAQLVKDRGLPWNSPQNWVPSPWTPARFTPTWPAQPAKSVMHSSHPDSPHVSSPEPAVKAAQSDASSTPEPLTQSHDGVSSDQNSLAGSKTATAAAAEAAEAAGLSVEAWQLLASFRLHQAAEPCVLATLDCNGNDRLSSLPPKLSYAKTNAHIVQSNMQLPASVSDADTVGSSLQHGILHDQDPHQAPAHDGTMLPDDSEGVTAPHTQIGDQDGVKQDHGLAKQQPGITPADQAAPASSSARSARSRAGSVGGREELMVEPKYTPGVPAPPRGTLQISATAGISVGWLGSRLRTLHIAPYAQHLCTVSVHQPVGGQPAIVYSWLRTCLLYM